MRSDSGDGPVTALTGDRIRESPERVRNSVERVLEGLEQPRALALPFPGGDPVAER